MGLTHLRHPIHGERVETSDVIIKDDIAHGWVVFDPNVPVELPAFLNTDPKGKAKK